MPSSATGASATSRAGAGGRAGARPSSHLPRTGAGMRTDERCAADEAGEPEVVGGDGGVVRPPVQHEAGEEPPTAGEIVKPCRLKPAATSNPSTPVAPMTGLNFCVTSKQPAYVLLTAAAGSPGRRWAIFATAVSRKAGSARSE